MRAILKSLPFAGITVLAWGSYGPTIHKGEAGLDSSKWAALLFVGLAYFIIAVIIPLVWLKAKGENGHWTKSGFVWGLGAGTCGALGALGIITAISSGGDPAVVMPIVFGGAPVVNTLVSMWMGKLFGQATNGFYLGIILVALGAFGVYYNKPLKAGTGADKVAAEQKDTQAEKYAMIVGGICLTVLCWGSYGSVLHKSQAKMAGSRLRPLFCVGLAYFLIAVLIPIIIKSNEIKEVWDATGATWSFIAGICGAVGALGIILSFTFGGKPAFVMPIVFGGAPIINTLIHVSTNNTEPISTMFVVSLTVVILGAITTLVCAPKPGKPAHPPVDAEPVLDDEVIEENHSQETATDADNAASGEEESTDDTATLADDDTGSDIADDGVIEAGGEDADDSQDDASATSEPSEDDTDNSIQEDSVSDSLPDSGENDSDDDSEGEGLVAEDSEDNDESDEDVESTEDDTASDDD
jgi:hypothetical protein